ncbi:MAG: hypothetical protein JSW07_03175 [bacterium]|nr:MAG: hypothetical protein JSW07_03175 [bacterium]
MKSIFVKVILFDPITGEEFHVFDGIEVEIVRILAYNPMVGFDSLRLLPDPQHNLFTADAPKYKVSKSHYFRVGFKKPNFSKTVKKLLAPEEVNPLMHPIFCPSRLPYWDSGWDDDYETNEFFNNNDVIVDVNKDTPLILRIPLRQIFNIGHRGAPHHFPENTMASFLKALDLGANGLEVDLCLTKDRKIIIFHDTKPIKHPTQLDRTIFENLPYELVSPEFTNDGKYVLIKELENENYKIVEKIRVNSDDEYDIINLTLEQVRKFYRYQHVNGVEYAIPDLDEFLTFASSKREHLHFIFFDIKNPDWNEKKQRNRFLEYGTLIGETLKKYPDLPEKMVICNPSKDILQYLKDSITHSGENRCEFSYDATGSLGALIGIKENPLRVARIMDNTVVSIGSLLRPGNLKEITQSTRYRDYNVKSKLTTVLHWTLNDPSQMYHSFTAGVNGILTDKPNELKNVFRKLRINLG